MKKSNLLIFAVILPFFMANNTTNEKTVSQIAADMWDSIPYKNYIDIEIVTTDSIGISKKIHYRIFDDSIKSILRFETLIFHNYINDSIAWSDTITRPDYIKSFANEHVLKALFNEIISKNHFTTSPIQTLAPFNTSIVVHNNNHKLYLSEDLKNIIGYDHFYALAFSRVKGN